MSNLRITRVFDRNKYNKVACIKAYRFLTNQGLKEAKDAIENIIDGKNVNFDIAPNLDPSKFSEQIEVLESNGFTLKNNDHQIEIILEATKQSAIMAINAGDSDLASILLNSLKKYENVLEEREARRIKEYEEKQERDLRHRERQERHEEIKSSQNKRWQESDETHRYGVLDK